MRVMDVSTESDMTAAINDLSVGVSAVAYYFRSIFILLFSSTWKLLVAGTLMV